MSSVINTGRLEGLRYAKSLVAMRRSGSNKLPAYVAALDDLDIFLDAAIERVEAGEEMHSVADTQEVAS